MTRVRRSVSFALAALVLVLLVQPAFAAERSKVPTPESVLGYNIGEDYKLTYWDKILEYFRALDAASDRLQLFRYGTTPMGREMVIAVISSESNMRQLEKFKNITAKLSDPRQLTDEKALELAKEGKAVYWICANIHSPEVGSSEMVMELAYKLLTSDEEPFPLIRENLIVIIDPSINPDGHDDYTNWYYDYINPKTAKQFVEKSRPPYYGKYISHDNNRDFIALATQEIQNNVKARMEWHPTIYHDLHQSGPARMFVSPANDPVDINVHPITLAQWIKIGGHIISHMTSEGYAGVVHMGYDNWYPGYNDQWTTLHNGTGILFETNGRFGANPEVNLPPKKMETERHWYQPMPWKGTIWRLRDNINYQERGVILAMEITAREKTRFLYDFYQKGRDNVALGKQEPPYAFVIPETGADPAAVAALVNNLLKHYVEVHRATAPFTAGGKTYPKGTYIVRMDQPYRSSAKTLLEIQHYEDYMPQPPYDVVAWTIGLLQDVRTEAIDDKTVLNVPCERVKKAEPLWSVEAFADGKPIIIENGTNNAVATAAVRLLESGAVVAQARTEVRLPGRVLPAGSLLVESATKSKIETLAKELGLFVYRAPADLDRSKFAKLRMPKIGLYHTWIDTMDEGWTRLLLENHGLPFDRLSNDDIKSKANLSQYDVIILPDVRRADNIYKGSSDMPDGYTGGVGDEGVNRLKAFAEGGGRLITIGKASEFALRLGLEGVKMVDTKSVTCPGSILKVNVNTSNPVAFGYDSTESVFFEDSPVFEVTHPGKVNVVATYPENPLQSGFLKDDAGVLPGKSAILQAGMGKGDVILFSPDIIYRTQASGNFSFLFNALFDAVVE